MRVLTRSATSLRCSMIRILCPLCRRREDVRFVVELEVAVPRLIPALR